MPSPSVTFVVVNWNGKHLLEQCIPSLQSQTFTDFEILVVDNGSTDGSLAYLQSISSVRAISLPENQGFAGPNNVAFRQAAGRWIATINNDLTLDPQWLKLLVEAIEQDPKCFAVQGKILKELDPGKIDTCGLGIRPCGAARNLAHNQDAQSIAEPREIFTVSAGAALYSKSVIEDLGFFDESYFAYYEDLDLGWRARVKGFSCKLIPKAIAYHKVHGTSGTLKNDQLWYLSERNRLRTMIKNLPVRAYLCHPFRILIDELRYLDMIRKKAGVRTIMRARSAAFGELRQLWRKRPPELKQLGAREWEHWLSLSV